jgi:hypothetical protein
VRLPSACNAVLCGAGMENAGFGWHPCFRRVSFLSVAEGVYTSGIDDDESITSRCTKKEHYSPSIRTMLLSDYGNYRGFS